jgi:hypothetical protein
MTATQANVLRLIPLVAFALFGVWLTVRSDWRDEEREAYEQTRIQQLRLNERDAVRANCIADGGVPVMGFGEIVCVKGAMWRRKTEW